MTQQQTIQPRMHPGAEQSMNAGTGGLHNPVSKPTVAGASLVRSGAAPTSGAPAAPGNLAQLLHALPAPQGPTGQPKVAAPQVSLQVRQLQEMVNRQHQFLTGGSVICL